MCTCGWAVFQWQANTHARGRRPHPSGPLKLFSMNSLARRGRSTEPPEGESTIRKRGPGPRSASASRTDILTSLPFFPKAESVRPAGGRSSAGAAIVAHSRAM